MRTIFLYIILSVNLVCISQNPLNNSYKGLSDGDKTDYYSNNQIRTKWTIKNGNIIGQHINYFKDGNLMSIESFDNGRFNGTNFKLNKNGDTLIVEKYKHDTILYFKESTYYKSGQLKGTREAFFKDSLKSNPFSKERNKLFSVEYDILKAITTNYNENIFKDFFKSGKLKSISYGIKNKMNGSYKEYFDDGKIKIETHYINDKLDGDYVEYNNKGGIIKKLKYKEGAKL